MSAELITVAERNDEGAAIVFVHGFGGSAAKTWGEFPEFLESAPVLADWNIYSLGYASSLAPDIRGVWSGDPGIETLAVYLNARATQHPLMNKSSLAFVAHSMGGLVVQRALLDFPELRARVSHVLLYGTPSGGLKKVGGLLGRLFKRQSQDMGLKSDFIKTLRDDWRREFGDVESERARPFKFWTVAGDADEFVPATSSLGPFAKKTHLVVPGNHLEIVKPGGVNSMSVQAAINSLLGKAAPAGPWNAAQVSIEMADFNAAIERLEPNAAELDVPSTVHLALALDRSGRREDAVRVLEQRLAKGGTDAMGTLAGRLKRMWWGDGIEKYATAALGLYEDAYQQSVAADDADQAYYHGINIAFMRFAFRDDPKGAQEMATKVLAHCEAARKADVWLPATIGEANLYLGDNEKALAEYERAVTWDPKPEPWQMEAMYLQATRVADVLGDGDLVQALTRLFRPDGDSTEEPATAPAG